MANKITILKGLPGSGKSTWAREQIKKSPSTIRVNKDEIRFMLYGKVKYKKRGERREGLVIKVRNATIRGALAEKKNVIVDDTNFNPIHEKTIGAIAGEFQAEVEVKFLDTPLYECLENNLNRERSVPESDIRQMYEQHIRPTLHVEQNPENPEAVIFDLDGTLALVGSRDPYDATDCEYDRLNHPVFEALMRYKTNGYKIIICSGRSSQYLPQTDRWLGKHEIEPDLFLMRKEGDGRQDAIMKREMFMNHIFPKYHVDVVYDDRNQVVDMWRDLGIPCFQVAPGNF